MIKYSGAFFLSILFFTGVIAQNEVQVVDKITAVVGDEIILKSDIEKELANFAGATTEEKVQLRCEILKQFLERKLLLTKAKQDSIVVSNEQVEGELDRRLQYFINQVGSETALETYYDKSIEEIKDEMREPIRQVLLTQQMQNKLVGDVKVTPEEVKNYYNSLPEDSLPYFNTEVEVGQVVVFVKPTREARQEAINKLKQIKKEIRQGSSFRTKAILYSDDQGSATQGGDLGMQAKNNYVPEFAAAAIKLPKDSLSGIIETKFGYHLIKMMERKGDNIHVKHILIKPKITELARARAKGKLDSIRNEIMYDTLNFAEAAFLFSEDENTSNNAGMIIDPQTGSSKIPLDKLDANLFFMIDTLKVGQVTDPFAFQSMDQRQGYRIVLLKSKTEPHKANLRDDYPKIRKEALNVKKMEKLDVWFKNYIEQTYIRIDDEYRYCKQLKPYLNNKQVNN